MKKLMPAEVIASEENDVIYTLENGPVVRDVTLPLGIGEEVFIAHLPDVHLNYCNQEDIDDANPVLMSTLEHRKWLANAESLPKLRACLLVVDDADCHVFNGDTLDYLSKGAMELMDREIWDKIPDVVATIGGHERAVQMQGKVPDTDTIEDRFKILEKYWRHDAYYHTRLLKNKVMVVGFCDDRAIIKPEVLEKFKADIEKCRKNGYVMLMFAHEPIVTHNPAHKEFTADMVMTKGDTSHAPWDFCEGFLLGGTRGDATSHEFYDTIVNNADVIKGFFAGHHHNDMEIFVNAKNSDGSDAIIPQYLATALAYGPGHVMRILVK